MNTQRLSAILLIAGFAVLILGFPFRLPGIYQTADPTEQAQIIEENQTRFNFTQVLIGLSLLLTTAGFFVLNTRLYTVANAWVPTLGAAAFIVALIPIAVFLYQQTTDPLSAYAGQYSGYETLGYWLWLAGLLLFGVAFLQAGLPAWLGYLTTGTAIVYGVVFLVTGFGWLTPGLVSLLGLVIGIVLLRQKPLL